MERPHGSSGVSKNLIELIFRQSLIATYIIKVYSVTGIFYTKNRSVSNPVDKIYFAFSLKLLLIDVYEDFRYYLDTNGYEGDDDHRAAFHLESIGVYEENARAVIESILGSSADITMDEPKGVKRAQWTSASSAD